jgi:alpha-ketoglutarate-dependent taurine dioxygenase
MEFWRGITASRRFSRHNRMRRRSGGLHMSIEVIPTGAVLGAEIRGIDLAQPLGDNAFAVIERAFDEHGVIFFRDQRITPSQQVAFTRRFGEIAFNIFGERWSVDGSPEIVVVSNVAEDGKPIGIRRAGENWHSDMCYTALPPRGTMLYAHEIPDLFGLPLGDTEFASAAAAWDALPDTLKARLEARRAIFDFTGRKRATPPTQAEIDRNPPVRHPVVRTHPRTGRRSLYVMRDDCTGVEGMEQDEAEVLIAALADHIVKPAFIYRHQWRAGDLLLWDNCTVQHRAIQDYDLPLRRVMHRTTMGGYAPA